MGNLKQAMLGRGNHVEGKPGLVGLPTIYHWSLIRQAFMMMLTMFPTIYNWSLIRDRVLPGDQLVNKRFPGPRSLYVDGGIHLTANSFLPEAILKVEVFDQSQRKYQ